MVDEQERVARLRRAQQQAAELFSAIETGGLIRGGVWESQATAAVYELAAERFGVNRHWHKRVIRSGPNTLRPYQENPPDRQITPDDVVFADLGPVFEGWEADFGRTWVLGSDPVAHQLCEDLQTVFGAGRAFFEAHPGITSAELYGEVVRLAGERGWEFGNFHCGHLVGEFPHENSDLTASGRTRTSSHRSQARAQAAHMVSTWCRFRNYAQAVKLPALLEESDACTR